jgi:hypothetical protein
MWGLDHLWPGAQVELVVDQANYHHFHRMELLYSL